VSILRGVAEEVTFAGASVAPPGEFSWLPNCPSHEDEDDETCPLLGLRVRLSFLEEKWSF
jgi:hypothetical protein